MGSNPTLSATRALVPAGIPREKPLDRLADNRAVDGVSIAMGIVALVLAGVWALARYGERLAPVPVPTQRASPRLGLVLLASGGISLAYAVLLLVAAGDVGRFLGHLLGGALVLVVARDMRRLSQSPA